MQKICVSVSFGISSLTMSLISSRAHSGVKVSIGVFLLGNFFLDVSTPDVTFVSGLSIWKGVGIEELWCSWPA